MNSSLIDMNEVCAYKLIQLRQYSGYTVSDPVIRVHNTRIKRIQHYMLCKVVHTVYIPICSLRYDNKLKYIHT